MSSAAIAHSRFPPSFDGNPWSYGFALFSLTLISAVTLAMLCAYVLDARAKASMNETLDNYVRQPSFSNLSPLTLHRQIVSGFLLTIFMLAFPRALVLLAWGEASVETMEFLFALERHGAGLVLLPFMVSVTLAVAAGQAVDHRLGLELGTVQLRVSWQRLHERLKMALVVLLIAVGVTLAKSVA